MTSQTPFTCYISKFSFFPSVLFSLKVAVCLLNFCGLNVHSTPSSLPHNSISSVFFLPTSSDFYNFYSLDIVPLDLSSNWVFILITYSCLRFSIFLAIFHHIHWISNFTTISKELFFIYGPIPFLQHFSLTDGHSFSCPF